MKKMLFLVLSSTWLLTSSSFIQASNKLPSTINLTTPTTDYSSFYQQLQEQISQQEQRVKNSMGRATSTSNMPMTVDKVQLQHAMDMLEVKRALYANFYNTPSIQNAAIRAKLLQIFTKSDVTEADLAELQMMVTQSRASP